MDELFDLAEGATVRNAAGEDLGRIERFVIDPAACQVTHLVVEKGWVFEDDRLAPIEMVETVDDRGAVLDDDVRHDDLPPFERHNYVEADTAARERFESQLGSASMWRFPTVATGMHPGFPAYPSGMTTGGQERPATEPNLPAGSVIVDETAVVVLPSGEEVGSVSEVVVTEDGRLSHLVVDLGFLSGERILPAHWIDAIDSGRVELAVGETALRNLEDRRS